MCCELPGRLAACALRLPRRFCGERRAFVCSGLGTRLQFLFFAVLVPVLAGELIKWIVGRGRPFVGGEANAFNFSHFAGSEAFASFPSGHAIASLRAGFCGFGAMAAGAGRDDVYAVLIALSRLVLLAHHPSDVVAGALIGVVGAMAVRTGSRRAGWASRSAGTARSCLRPGPRGGTAQKGCPRGVSPIRSGRRKP